MRSSKRDLIYKHGSIVGETMTGEDLADMLYDLLDLGRKAASIKAKRERRIITIMVNYWKRNLLAGKEVYFPLMGKLKVIARRVLVKPKESKLKHEQRLVARKFVVFQTVKGMQRTLDLDNF